MNKTMLRFRVWNTKDKKFIKGYLKAWDYFNGFCSDNKDERNLGLSFWHEPDGYFKILKSTGLKDKKGVEIFEGDILKVKTKYDGNSIEYVKWDDENYDSFPFGGWCCNKNVGWRLDEVRVIGNIMENPELLEEVSK